MFNSEFADWYGEREGSDTLIIASSAVAIGDVFLITVYCRNECEYDLRTFYAPLENINGANRRIFRWGGHSTAVLSYDIPSITTSIVEEIDIRIEPEGDYKYIEAHISFGR